MSHSERSENLIVEIWHKAHLFTQSGGWGLTKTFLA
jgi:hypothetical protein